MGGPAQPIVSPIEAIHVCLCGDVQMSRVVADGSQGTVPSGEVDRSSQSTMTQCTSNTLPAASHFVTSRLPVNNLNYST